MTDTSITQTILPMVDRASYDKLKQVAIELSKQLEKMCCCTQNMGIYKCTCCDAIDRAKDIIGGDK